MALASLAEIQEPQHRIIGSFDHDTWAEGRECLVEIGGQIGLAKYNALADEVGAPQIIDETHKLGALTMLDYKILDIDKTSLKRARAQTAAGAAIITAHAANSPDALNMIVEGVGQAVAANPALRRPWVLGVTVLTSVTDKGEVCQSIFGADRTTKVREFAQRAADAGFDGVVCSPREAEMLKADTKTAHLKVVLPAIRPAYAQKPDEQQTNALTATQAIRAGGDLLVIGRPITDAPQDYSISYAEAVAAITEEIRSA